MNWNPFKRIAELEANIKFLLDLHDQNVGRINDLTFKLQAQGKDYNSKYNSLSIALKEHDERLASLQNQLIYRTDATRPSAPVGFTSADVEKAAKKRLQRAAYARKYYAKKRAAKAAVGGAK